MKKVYLLLCGMAVAGLTFAQDVQPQAAYSIEGTAKSNTAESPTTFSVPANRSTQFTENFDGPAFPPVGWVVQSGDSSNVTHPDQQWHEEGGGNPGSCASVMYVNSFDVHDEWLMTPEISIQNNGSDVRLEFQINTSQYWHVAPHDNADIRCYVSTVSNSIADLKAGTEVFWEEMPSIVNEWETYEWFTAQVDLSAFAGQTIYMGWHYYGQDGAQFSLDNVTIYDVPFNDVEAVEMFVADVNNDWEIRLYDNAQRRPIGITSIIRNNGALTQTNVGFDYVIKDRNGNAVDQGAATSTIWLLHPGDQDTVFLQTAFTPPAGAEDYTVEIFATADAPDANNTNDALSRGFSVSTNQWGGENGPIDGGITNILGGQGLPVSFGNQMVATADRGYTGAWLGLGPNSAGQAGELVYCVLYEYNENTGDYNYLAETENYTLTGNEAGQYVFIPWSGGGTMQIVAGRQYLLTANHYGGANDVEFGTSGTSMEGTVLGYNNANIIFRLLDPPTIAVRLGGMTTGLEEEANNAWLGQSLPNPANDAVTIPYELATAGNVTLSVYDITGKRVMVVNKGMQPAGPNNFQLYTGDLEAGVYNYVLTTDETRQSKQMIIAR